MDKDEQVKFIDDILRKIKVELKNEEMFNLIEYKNLIIDWNEKINLTAIIEDREFIIKHLVDSLTINKYINENESIIDIGTGAGFPGIPLKIVNSTNKVVLLDSLNKRLKVLEDIIGKLNLKNIDTLHGRAEEIFQNKDYREKFDIATARAVSNLNVLVELMLPAVKIGGKCICMKGKNGIEELNDAKKAIEILGGKVTEVEELTLPESDFKRTIIIIEKIKSTPIKYPRKPGIPQSKMLK